MQKSKFVIRVINRQADDCPHFFTRTSRPKQRIEHIKKTLAQNVVPFEHMAAFKGQQDVLDFEIFKQIAVLKYDSVTDSFVKIKG